MDPYIDGLIQHLELRFQQLGILGAFSSLGPQGPQADESQTVSDLQLLAKQFPPISEKALPNNRSPNNNLNTESE